MARTASLLASLAACLLIAASSESIESKCASLMENRLYEEALDLAQGHIREHPDDPAIWNSSMKRVPPGCRME